MPIHNPIGNYTISVIRSVMGAQTVPPMPEGVTLEGLYAFARLHNVEALLWHGLSQLEIPEENPVWQDWENRAAMLLAQGVVQLADRDALFEALTGAGIPLLPVKGCWLKELYPNMEYRQMADLDVLVPEDQLQRAKQILLSLGYTTDAVEDSANHAGFLKPPYTEVELHVRLLEHDNGYYRDVWQRVQPVEGYPCLYRFSPEDEYIYYILHFHKHLEDAGTGIRSVLDSLVYRTAWPELNWTYLQQELEKWGLWELTRNLHRLCQSWFQTGEPVPADLEVMAEAILNAGSYGNVQTRSRNRLDKLREKYPNPLIRAIVYCCIRVCRPREEMERSFPVLRKVPFLLPVFWIYRMARRFLNRPGEIWRHTISIFRKENRHGSD